MGGLEQLGVYQRLRMTTRVEVEEVQLESTEYNVEKNTQKCNWGHVNAMSRQRCITGAWLHVLLESNLGIGRQLKN